MNLRKTTVLLVSLALMIGLAASICQAQDREREAREKAPKAEKDRGPQGDNPVLEKLRALEKQQAELEDALARVRQAALSLREQVQGERPREEARPAKPGEREREAARPAEKPKEPARITEDQLRQRRLAELEEQSRQLRMQAEAMAAQRPKAKATEEKDQGVKIVIDGKEFKLGASGTFVVPGVKMPADKGREEGEQVERREREVRENPAKPPAVRIQREGERAPRPGATEGAKEGEDQIKVFINGKEINLGGGKELEGRMEGRLIIAPGVRPGQEGIGGWQQIPPAPGTLKPMPPGGAPNPMPGSPLGLKPGALGQPGRGWVAQEREEREEMEERGGRAGRRWSSSAAPAGSVLADSAVPAR